MHHLFVDRLAAGDSPVHRLDARVKLLAVLAYTVVLIGFDRYAIASLAPLSLLPLGMIWFAGVPTWFAVRRVLILCPFILMLVVMSPFCDPEEQVTAFGPWQFSVSGGWLTAADISIKFALGVTALTALTCSTPFTLLLEAMRRLAVPKLVVLQIGLLYRYLFVLMDEALRMRRARDFRGASQSPVGRRLAAVGGVIGTLFLRTLERSERVQLAMLSRGFRGEIHSLVRLRWTIADAVFAVGAAAYLAICVGWAYG